MACIGQDLQHAGMTAKISPLLQPLNRAMNSHSGGSYEHTPAQRERERGERKRDFIPMPNYVIMFLAVDGVLYLEVTPKGGKWVMC